MADRFIIIGQEKSQCSTCFAFFIPASEYHQRCEQRNNFPADFPNQAKKNPYAYCSASCEQIAIDEVKIGRIEFERMLQVTA